MGSLIGLLIEFVLNLLLTLLPLSPFTGFQLDGQVQTAIGWLNWIMPVKQMVALMLAWIGAAVTITIVGFVIDNIEKIERWLLAE